MNRTITIFAVLAIAACGSEKITTASGGIEVSEKTLSFPDTWIGHPTQRQLEVRNLGRPSLKVEVRRSLPFRAPETLSLPGSGTAVLTVEFDPSKPGPFAGEMTIGLGDAAVKVALEGTALEVPACDPGDECRRFFFDPAAGGCVPDLVANGTKCGEACFDGGECRDGVCVTNSNKCEPPDACTVAGCDPEGGCTFSPKICPPSEDKCRSPVCDPVDGCGFAAAPDGTVCGPSDCSSAHICLAGKCVESESPDGGPCGDESPCQERGVCRKNVCVQPPKTTLLQTWTNAASGSNRILFGGTTDPVGNLFWAECDTLRCSLVKATVEGFELFREPLSDGTRASGALALSGERIVSTLRPGWIEAYDARLGTPLWSRDVGASVLDGADGAWVELGELVVHGALVTTTAEGWIRKPTLKLLGGWLVAVDLATGELRWVRSFDGGFAGLVGDDAGRLYLATQKAGAAPSDPASLVSLGPAGGDRWSVETPWRPPVGVAGSYLLQASSDLRRNDDGVKEAALDMMFPLFPDSPLLGGHDGWVFGYPMGTCGTEPCPIWTPKLFRIDPLEKKIDFAVDVQSGDATQRTEPSLTATGGILFAEAVDNGGGTCQRTFRLVDIEPDGELGFECMLPKGRYGGATSLLAGRWAVLDTCGNHAIKVFTVKDYDLAAKGWVTTKGNPGRTGKPR